VNIQPDFVIRTTRWLAIASLAALIGLILVWELWLQQGSWWVLKSLPLLLPLNGFIQKRLYTYRWASLLVWLYFVEGATLAFTDHGLKVWFAGFEVALSVGLFMACALHVKYRLKVNKTTS
jgi:uncharacterized membrane protein